MHILLAYIFNQKHRLAGLVHKLNLGVDNKEILYFLIPISYTLAIMIFVLAFGACFGIWCLLSVLEMIVFGEIEMAYHHDYVINNS